MINILDLVFGKNTKPYKRIPGNMAKRALRRCANISRGFTIARPHTQEYKRIIAASKTKGWSRNPRYGSKQHLKWLKKLIVHSKLRALKAEGENAILRHGNAVGKTPPAELDRVANELRTT